MREKPYPGRVVAVQQTGLTAAYYLMYGRGCRRVSVVRRRGKWYLDESPYDPTAGTLCRRPGSHPHTSRGTSRKRGRRG